MLPLQGCAQEYFGITPDLTCMGKVIGGGLPVGAYGGKKEIMSMVSPAGVRLRACAGGWAMRAQVWGFLRVGACSVKEEDTGMACRS